MVWIMLSCYLILDQPLLSRPPHSIVHPSSIASCTPTNYILQIGITKNRKWREQFSHMRKSERKRRDMTGKVQCDASLTLNDEGIHEWIWETNQKERKFRNNFFVTYDMQSMMHCLLTTNVCIHEWILETNQKDRKFRNSL